MIELCKLVAMVAFAAWDAQGAQTPQDISRGLEPETTLRVFLKMDNSSLYSELRGSWQTDSRSYRSLLLGGYHQPFRNLRVGAFYQLQFGERHDEDWIKTDEWHWQDTRTRGESLLVLDISPKGELAFLPGENWVGELKLRYLYNFFNQNQTLKIRPGLTYFWLRNGQAFINWFFQYELYFPINYGNKTIYESWGYLGAIYNLSTTVQLGGYGAMKTVSWGSTSQFTATTNQVYTAKGDSTALGLIAILQFGN